MTKENLINEYISIAIDKIEAINDLKSNLLYYGFTSENKSSVKIINDHIKKEIKKFEEMTKTLNPKIELVKDVLERRLNEITSILDKIFNLSDDKDNSEMTWFFTSDEVLDEGIKYLKNKQFKFQQLADLIKELIDQIILVKSLFI